MAMRGIIFPKRLFPNSVFDEFFPVLAETPLKKTHKYGVLISFFQKVVGKTGENWQKSGFENSLSITGGSVMVVVEDVEDKLVLVGQSRYTLNNMYSWEFVGGGMESEKNPLQVARKELKEETGIEGDSWTELGYFYPLNGISTEKCFVFLVRDLKFGQANNEATEDISLRKVTIPEIQQMININEISCGMTIATFYKYLIYK